MANSFRELQTVYESYPLRNDTLSNNKYYPAKQGKHTLLGYPGSSPSGEGMPTVAIPADDEEDDALVSTLKQQLNEFIKEAEEEHMEFARVRFLTLLQTLHKYK